MRALFNAGTMISWLSEKIGNPGAVEQMEKGEQLAQSLSCSACEFCSVISSSSQLSNTEQGSIALKKM